MSNVICLNCGTEHIIEQKDILKDDKGEYVYCSNCGATFDVNRD